MPEINEKLKSFEVNKLDSGLEAMNKNLERAEQTDISPTEITDFMADFEASINERMNKSETAENIDAHTDGVNVHDHKDSGNATQNNTATNHSHPSFGYNSCERVCRQTGTKVGFDSSP